MKKLFEKREKARILRKAGYSIKEITEELSAVKSTVSLWVRDVELSKEAKTRILSRISAGQFKAAENKKARTRTKENSYLDFAKLRLARVNFTPDIKAFLCGAMYWCEGAKGLKGGMAFTNSDPELMRTFIYLFRQTFVLDESKFHPILHVHEYHDVRAEIAFWSKMIKIKTEQFARPYLKSHTGKRTREGYHGCLSLRYYDNDIARQLLALGKALIGK